MPTRVITFAEAKLKRWPYFYDGGPCVHGHVAPRRVNNQKICIDCERIRNGKPTIGLRGKAAIQKRGRPPVGSRRQALRNTDKEFLVALADLKSFDAACVKVGLDSSEMRARVSSFPQLRAAVNDLERRIGVGTPEPEPTKPKVFAWTDEARAQFVEAYVDTGDIASARDAIGVTPSEYYRELERNPAFGTAVKSAEALAMRALEERAIQLSLKGNDKLLQKLLAAKMPEQYSERVRLDVKQETTHKLDDRALHARIHALLSKNKDAIDAEFTELESGGSRAALEGPRGD